MRNRIAFFNRRRAAVAPMAAMFMTILTGMLAFSIDIGYISSVQAELQDAADAAALAGAERLQDFFVLANAPGQTNQQGVYTTATTDTTSSLSPIPTAQQYAYYNQAGGVNVVVPVSDISFSYYDGTTFSSASATNFPNTCNVITRRDTNSNGPLGLFFGQIFGMSNVNLTATASATIFSGYSGAPGNDANGNPRQGGNLTNNPPFTTGGGSKSTITIDAHVLPVALDVNTWSDFVNSNWTSPYLSGVVSTNANNSLPQLQVYPNATNTPGNFGLIDLGPPATNTPAFRAWIDSGVTPNDISYLLNNNLMPVSPSAPANWTVGPGIKSTLLTNFQSVMGQANLIPLFQPYSPLPSYIAAANQGSTATYAVVGFVGVAISQAEYEGTNMTISVQPKGITSPTLVIPYPLPAATISQQSSFTGYVSAASSTSTYKSTSSYNPSSANPFAGPGGPNTFLPAKLTR